MKSQIPVLFLFLFTLLSCEEETHDEVKQTEKTKNEVIVLGTVHGSHLTEDEFSIEVLTNLIREINPDIILTEIPPDRFPIAMKQFQEFDSISEPRVIRFPEYIDVIFPLSKEMDFLIIPTAGWTEEMALNRRNKLHDISLDSTRTSEWKELKDAEFRSDSLIKATGKEFDPFWINSDEYDQLVEIELSVYNRLFNDELGLGGWDNINEAHFLNISNALDQHQYQGKRILITYGAGHKGWFLKELEKRNDIQLKNLSDVATKSH